MLIKLRSKRFSRSNSKLSSSSSSSTATNDATKAEIKWEVRPGGMLVQKRSECKDNEDDEMITIRVSTVSNCHDISILSTSTFGELKVVLSVMTKLEPREQRLLFKGKEREDNDYLHMVGVRDNDKVLMLEDPAIKEMKLLGLPRLRLMGSTYRTISV